MGIHADAPEKARPVERRARLNQHLRQAYIEGALYQRARPSRHPCPGRITGPLALRPLGPQLGHNEERAHTGRLTNGRTPAEVIRGGRKMRPR